MHEGSETHTSHFRSQVDLHQIAILLGEASWVNGVIRQRCPEERLLVYYCGIDEGNTSVLEIVKPETDTVLVRVLRNMIRGADADLRPTLLLQSLRRIIQAADRR